MDLAEFLYLKYGDLARGGWGPRLRAKFGYITPDDRYEFVVNQSVTPETDWLDVGCGRFLFANNRKVAEILAARCRSLSGIDPSANIFENEILGHREQCMLEDYEPAMQYDLVTMRMVVEHIVDPTASVAALARLLRPGGRAIVYTVNKWSPVSMMSAITPLSFHIWAKSYLWGGEDKDSFPTIYRMNTRATLAAQFSAAGFIEERFEYLSDTRTLTRFKLTNAAELTLWRALRSVGIGYPENCLLGIYRRQ